MKIRMDFVTNSSSSSFIISTNETIDERFKQFFNRITENNLIDVLDEDYDVDWIMDREFNQEKIQELGKFSDEQIKFVRNLVAAAYCNKLQEYLDLREKLKNDDAPIYHISYETNYSWSEEIYDYVQSLLEKEEEAER